MSRIDHTLKIFRLVPHALARELKEAYLTMCLQLFPELRTHAHDNQRHLVKGDESRFDYEHGRDRTQTDGAENMPGVENNTIPSRKCMLAILWNS
jgi:hypothetical protein